jgi:hypothetical protein
MRDPEDSNAAGKHHATFLLCDPEGVMHRETLRKHVSPTRLRFKVKSLQLDTEISTDTRTQALAMTPSGHPDCSHTLFGVALVYLAEDTSYSSISYALRCALDLIRDSNNLVVDRVRDAVALLADLTRRGLLIRGDQQILLELYQEILHFLPMVAFDGRSIHSRLRILAKTVTLATNGAVIALRQGQHDVAIEILEEDRAFFWSQYLRARMSMVELPEQLRDQLIFADGGLDGSSLSKERTLENESTPEELHNIGRCFESLVAQARTYPGFERFYFQIPTRRLLSQQARFPWWHSFLLRIVHMLWSCETALSRFNPLS